MLHPSCSRLPCYERHESEASCTTDFRRNPAVPKRFEFLVLADLLLELCISFDSEVACPSRERAFTLVVSANQPQHNASYKGTGENRRFQCCIIKLEPTPTALLFSCVSKERHFKQWICSESGAPADVSESRKSLGEEGPSSGRRVCPAGGPGVVLAANEEPPAELKRGHRLAHVAEAEPLLSPSVTSES